jgi:GTP:adenosylcobinamide-phosphate guanylyltransferase
MSHPLEHSFAAIILAGERGPDDEVARAAGVCCKSLVPVNGQPMVLRVMDTLDATADIGNQVLCGPDWSAVEQNAGLKKRIESGIVHWIAPKTSPSCSAFRALQSLPKDQPALITTADHALLTTDILDYFCEQARASDCDVMVGLALDELVSRTYPDVARTVIRFRDNGYQGCNLFAFMSAESREVARFWKRMEHHRKQPLRIAGALGWWTVLRYLLNRLSLEEALAAISKRVQVRIGAVILPFPEAAIDIDKVSDWEFAERVLGDERVATGTDHLPQ